MDSDTIIYDFYHQRIQRRIELIEEEITDIITHQKGTKNIKNIPSESYTPSQDSEMEIQEKEIISNPKLNKTDSNQQKSFDMNLKRAGTQGSIVLEEYDYSDIKKVLRDRLINYQESINYCYQIGQKKEIISDLEQKADLIQHFITNYSHNGEDDYLQLIAKLPRNITPQDIFGDSRRADFIKYIEYIEKLIPQIQRERNKMMEIFKKQKDQISKENTQKLIKLVRNQEAVKEKLLKLAGNKWQPLPDIHISELHFQT